MMYISLKSSFKDAKMSFPEIQMQNHEVKWGSVMCLFQPDSRYLRVLKL